MRALTLTSFGGLDSVVLADVPEPEAGQDTVTVRVHAAALGRGTSLPVTACSPARAG